jgi:predicted phosphodiesterase
VLPVSLRVIQYPPRDLVVARFLEPGLDDLVVADLEQGGAGKRHQNRRMGGDKDLGLARFEKRMKLGQERKLALRRQRRLGLVHDEYPARLQSMLEKSDERFPVRALVKGPSAVREVRITAEIWDAVPDGVRVAARHGTPKSDMEGIDPRRATGLDARRWLADAEADVLVVGHTHIAFALQVAGGGLIVNPGALLRDPAHRSDPGAMLFDPDTGKSVPMPPLEGGTFGVLELPAKTFTVYRAADGAEVDILRIDAPEPRPTQ